FVPDMRLFLWEFPSLIFGLCTKLSAQTYSNPLLLAPSTWAISDMVIDRSGNLFFCGYQWGAGGNDGRIYEIRKTSWGFNTNSVLIASGLGQAWALAM